MNQNPVPSASRAARGSLWDHLAAWQGLPIFLLALLLYLPGAGGYGLWDPWETHYGEVARQMTLRQDFISLWWPGSPRESEVFQTKPVLSYWLMSLGMQLAGIGGPDGPAHEMAFGTRAEWALRTPFCLLGALGVWAVHLVTARLANRRAAALAALVTATFPLYALVARQAMTDMSFVALMTLALALGALALSEAERAPLPRRGWRRLSWPHHRLFYLAAALFLIATVPQLLVDSIDLRVKLPWGGRLVTMYGVVAMLPYWAGTALALLLFTRARDRARLHLYGAATLCGLAVLGKGLAGLGLPVLVFAGHLVASGQWRMLSRRRLLWALPVCLLVVAVVAIPWHHAMYIRHGEAWWSELFGDNHWRRLVVGRHGDRGTFDYFLQQLGYGAWPAVALAAPALALAVLRRSPPGAEDPAGGRGAALRFGAVWFVTAYALVSLSMTKFHHYLLPALPGLGILLGCFVDELWSRQRGASGSPPGAAPDRAGVGQLGALVALLGIPVLLLTTGDLVRHKDAAERFLWLFSYDYVYSAAGRPWPEALDFRGPLLLFAGLASLGLGALPWRRLRRPALLALGASALGVTLFLLHHFMPRTAGFWSQKDLVAHYYRQRRGPDERLIAYRLFWRGETFYTKNEIFQGPAEERTVFDFWPDTDARLTDWLNRHRGRRHFFLFDPSREATLRRLLPAEAAASFRIIDRRHIGFVLAVAEL